LRFPTSKIEPPLPRRLVKFAAPRVSRCHYTATPFSISAAPRGGGLICHEGPPTHLISCFCSSVISTRGRLRARVAAICDISGACFAGCRSFHSAHLDGHHQLCQPSPTVVNARDDNGQTSHSCKIKRRAIFFSIIVQSALENRTILACPCKLSSADRRGAVQICRLLISICIV
jgi:hypothetical protein